MEKAGGALSLSPGHTFQLNTIEKEGLREARKAREIAEAIEEMMAEEIQGIMKTPACPSDSDDEPNKGFGNDNSNLEDYAESGEDEILESNVGTRDQGDNDRASGSYDNDDDLWEEQVINANYALQEAQYLNVEPPTPRQFHPPPYIVPTNSPPSPDPPSPWYNLADSSIEIDIQ